MKSIMFRSNQKGVLSVEAILIISILYFMFFISPNKLGSVDVNMLSVYEPDEFAQYPHVMRMALSFDDGINIKSLLRFVSYQHYYYGFPFYFISNTLALYPLKFTIGLGSVKWNMLMLRQIISVLPMLLALIFWVFLQTKFQSVFKSVVLFIFLLSIPAVVENNFWWHPESIEFLWITLVFFFLDRDKSSFGKNYYLAAFFCGLAISTKLIGLFFFLTIPIYILLSVLDKKITLKQAFLHAVGFVTVMIVTFWVSSPMLWLESQRELAWNIQVKQAEAMSKGWSIFYAKGFLSWMPIIREYYSSIIMWFLSLIALGIGIASSKRRNFYILIASWFLPFFLYITTQIAIKPTHFLLPVFIPVFSSIVTIMEFEKPLHNLINSFRTRKILLTPFDGFILLGLIILGLQLGSNIGQSYARYREEISLKTQSPEVSFFRNFILIFFYNIPDDSLYPIKIYRDVRVYVPDKPQFDVEIQWGLFDYTKLEKISPDLLVLWKQRILDYTQENTLDISTDTSEMEQAMDFYNDAKHKQIKNYTFLMASECCIVFAENNWYKNYLNLRDESTRKR